MNNFESERRMSIECGNSIGRIEYNTVDLEPDTLRDLAQTLINDSTTIVVSFTYKDGETKDIKGSYLEKARSLEEDKYERFIDGIVNQLVRAHKVSVWKPNQPINHYTGQTGEEMMKFLNSMDSIDSI